MTPNNSKPCLTQCKRNFQQVPFGMCNMDMSMFLPFFAIDWHEEVEIAEVTGGSGQFVVGSSTVQANAGDIVIVPPFQMHRIVQTSTEPLLIRLYTFNIRMLDKVSSDSMLLKYFLPLFNDKSTSIVKLDSSHASYADVITALSRISVTDTSVNNWQTAVKSNLYWLLYHLFKGTSANSDMAVEDKRLYVIKKALQYIKSSYTQQISISELASHSGYNEYYMMKLFKQYTGHTIIDYVNKYRLNIAGELLLSTDSEINIIAQQVGYNNISYFNRQFISLYGMTPQQFRSSHTLSK